MVGNDSSDPNLQNLINQTNEIVGQGGSASQATPAQHAQAAASIGSHYLAAAKAGTFSIDPAVGEANLRVINNVIQNKLNLAGHIQQIQQRTKLGETPHAEAFADWNMQVAATGPFAFVPVHQQIIQALRDMAQAVQIAMDNYHRADEGAADTFRSTEH